MTAHQGIFIEIIDLYNWEPLQKSYKFKNFLNNVDPKIVTTLQEGFAVYILDLMKSMIRNAIYYQRFPIPLKPLSPAYLAEKKRKNRHQGIWESTRFLCNNLTFWKTDKNSFAIGFRPTTPHPNSKLSVLEICKIMEQGTKDGRIPARPIFFPISAGISKNIFNLFQKFIKAKYPQFAQYLNS